MKKAIIFAMLASLYAVSCYEDFITDYHSPNMGFALTRQVRSVIESRNSIYVGVSIGGKREVDLNDWATFEIDEALLAGTGKTLLPASHYKLADPNTFRVRRTGIAVADVEITFTDDFYADPISLSGDYALPFRITGVSIPAQAGEDGTVDPRGAIREGAGEAVVAIKYIDEYSGVYYKMGSVTEVNASGAAVGTAVNYGNTVDINACQTSTLVTVGRNMLSRSGLGNSTSGSMVLTIDSPREKVSNVSLQGNGTNILNAAATLLREGDYTFYGGTSPCPQINLQYTYVSGGKYYKVTETLVLRQWAENALRVETF